MKSKVVFLTMVVLLGFALMGQVEGAEQKVIKLKFASYFVPTHPISVLNQKFCDEIKKRTNGRVEISHHTSSTLLSAPKIYQGVVSGITDIGMSNISYTRGRFPVIDLLDLPLGYPSAYAATMADNDFYNKFKPKDFDSVHILYLHACSPYVIYTTKKPVRTLEDLKGLKIAGKGRIADLLKALGAVPVPLETGDYYDSLSRGIVDGAASPINTLKDWKLAEVAKYAVNLDKLGAVYTFYVAMNKNKWNALPNDMKKVFTDVSLECQQEAGHVWDAAAKDGADFLLQKGGQIVNLSDQEAAKWQKAIEPLINTYLKETESLGNKRSDLEGYIKYVQERISYWYQQGKAGKAKK